MGSHRQPIHQAAGCTLVALNLALASLACSGRSAAPSSTPTSGKVTGAVLYRERMMLPPGSVVEVQLEDVSRADAPAETVASVEMKPTGGPPFPFELAFDRARIVESHTYAVRARISGEGRLLFVSDQAHPVLTGGHPSEVEILVRGVSGETAPDAAPGANPPGAAPGADAPGATPEIPETHKTPGTPETQEKPLPGTVWQWQRTLMYDDSVTEPADPKAFTLEFQPDGRLVARVDCNRGAGKYSVEGSKLQIGPMALTRAFCGPESLDTVFVKQLERVASYLMDGDDLVLELETHSGGMHFAPAP